MKTIQSLLSNFLKGKRNKKEPLPPHERTKRWRNSILDYVYRHRIIGIDNFNEFKIKFEKNQIPRELVNKIDILMRRERNDRHRNYIERHQQYEDKKTKVRKTNRNRGNGR